MAVELVAERPMSPSQIVGHPDWWIRRLYKQLNARRETIDLFNDYYIGDHPLPWLAPQAREEFRRILRMTRTNYMGLVCDATMERVKIEGFRFGADSKSDTKTWDIWQYNNLDADSGVGFLESLIAGSSYYLVARNPDDESMPRMWVEDATQAIVEYEPGSNRRVRHAGAKCYVDDWTGKLWATLFLMWHEADGSRQLRVFKYEAPAPRNGNQHNPSWYRREVAGEEWGGLGGMDKLPLVEVPNNPRIRTGGRSELYDLTDIQDRINKTVADRLITQDYGAFPQKWIKGWPEFQEDGTTRTPPIDIGRNRAVTTDAVDAEFGQWDGADLGGYNLSKREDVKDIASRSRTPAQYLLGEINNVNGETLKASESGHIAKVRQRMRPWAESTEEGVRMLRELAGLSGPNEHRMETVFANPEFRTEGELVDATVKKLQSRIASLRQARVDCGYSDTEIQRLEQEDEREALHPVIVNAIRDLGNEVPPHQIGAGDGANAQRGG